MTDTKRLADAIDAAVARAFPERWMIDAAISRGELGQQIAEQMPDYEGAVNALERLLGDMWRYSFEYTYDDGEVSAEEQAAEALRRVRGDDQSVDQQVVTSDNAESPS